MTSDEAVADIQARCKIPDGVAFQTTADGHIVVVRPDCALAFMISLMVVYDGWHCEAFNQMIGVLMDTNGPTDITTQAAADIRANCVIPEGVSVRVERDCILVVRGDLAFAITDTNCRGGYHIQLFNQTIGALMAAKEDVLVRLQRYATLKVGDEIPSDLGGPNAWGPPLSETLNDAIAEIKNSRAIIGVGESRYFHAPDGADKADIGLMRRIAIGDESPPYGELHPRDWRPGAISSLLFVAAKEIEFLRLRVGCVSDGPSVADLKEKARLGQSGDQD